MATPPVNVTAATAAKIHVRIMPSLVAKGFVDEYARVLRAVNTEN
jgi:hypothetical protein